MVSWLAPPSTFGFSPSRFPDWRHDQPDAIRAVLESIGSATKGVQTHTALVLPTGAGKTATALTIARLTGLRMVYLTATKALMDQTEREVDFVTLLKGQSSYGCAALLPGGEYADWNPDPDGSPRHCGEGPCHVGKPCSLKGDERTSASCTYFASVARALRSRLLVTNYACWLAHRLHAVGLGTTDCLVLDESHAAPDELAGALRVELPLRDVKDLGLGSWPDPLNTEQGWKTLKGWAATAHRRLAPGLEHAPSTRGEALHYRRAQRVSSSLERLLQSDPDITLARDQYGKLSIEPVWAATFVDALWKDIPHIVYMSATVRPKTLELLGVSPEQTTWFESGGDFPVQRRPVYHYPVAQVRHNWSPMSEYQWLSGIDAILRLWPDVKGIIHTVSYARRNLILQRSEFRSRMISHDREDTASQIAKFKASPDPLILVSPSVTTGYDFPGDECRFQIIGKVPFPDSRDPITERRSVLDPDYPMYVAMQEIVQSTGRPMRSKDDWAITYILDNNFGWFYRKYRHFAPRWFCAAVQRVTEIPPRPSFSA